MDKIIITNQVLNPDNTYKLSYKATFADNSTTSGHVMIGQDGLEEMSMKDIRVYISSKIISNLGGTTQ